MQCVRCSHPLPPRADRCLRCFALNPQNRPEPLPTAPLGSSGIKPLALSFESDPPPPIGALEGLSFHSDPPSANNVFARSLPPLAAPAPAPVELEPLAEISGPHFTPHDDAEFSFDDPSLAAPPRRVIDLDAPKPVARDAPAAPDTLPSPPPEGMQRAPEERLPSAPLDDEEAPSFAPNPQQGKHDSDLAGLSAEIGAALDAVLETRAPRATPSMPGPASFLEDPAARMTEPAITPAPMIDLPPEPAPRPAGSDATAAAPDEGERQAPGELPAADDAGLLALARHRQEADAPARDAAPVDRTAPEPAAASDLAGFHDPDAPPRLGARLTAWALDGALIALVSLLFVGLAALQLGGRKLAPLGAQSWESWLDGLLFAHRLPLFWALLFAALGVGYSWLFTALGGRTPGLRAAGLKLEREDGSPLDPLQALRRSALALASALPALFGFILALFDPRGQTLHDKLSRSRLVVSGGARREST